MSEDLNYGYTAPEANDESRRQWMPTVTAFIKRIVDHVHDGNDSALIPSSAISRSELDIISGWFSASGLTYTAGDTVVDLLIAGASGDLYVKGDDLNYETIITGATGTTIGLSSGVTGDATGDGTIEVSRWKWTKSSTYEYDLTLPTAYPSSTSQFKFSVLNDIISRQNYETFPTLVFSDVNTVNVKVNRNDYDLSVVVL